MELETEAISAEDYHKRFRKRLGAGCCLNLLRLFGLLLKKRKRKLHRKVYLMSSNMVRKFVIFRLVQGLWNAVHVNIDSGDIANSLLRKLKEENPAHKFRVMQTSEEIVYEDK